MILSAQRTNFRFCRLSFHPHSFSLRFFLFLSFALSLSSSDAKMAARVAAAMHACICIRRWRRRIVSKLRIRRPPRRERGLGNRPFARYTLCNPCIQIITYAYIAVVCQPVAMASSPDINGGRRISSCQTDRNHRVESTSNDSAISHANVRLYDLC